MVAISNDSSLAGTTPHDHTKLQGPLYSEKLVPSNTGVLWHGRKRRTASAAVVSVEVSGLCVLFLVYLHLWVSPTMNVTFWLIHFHCCILFHFVTLLGLIYPVSCLCFSPLSLFGMVKRRVYRSTAVNALVRLLVHTREHFSPASPGEWDCWARGMYLFNLTGSYGIVRKRDSTILCSTSRWWGPLPSTSSATFGSLRLFRFLASVK